MRSRQVTATVGSSASAQRGAFSTSWVVVLPAAALLLSSALTACGGEAPEPVVPTPVATVPPPPPPPPPPIVTKEMDTGSQGDINISADIRAACGISEAEALFAFDSATVRKGDLPVLDKLAACFSSGKLAGRRMRLVGHADPRGDEEYNLVLGGRRADGVRQYLIGSGMSAGQVDSTSRGEMDATGTDDASWARDRRVDVLLAD